MRGVIFDALLRRMEVDESIFFLTGDMGINLVEPIEEAFPDRFVNVGIAEQNLIGVAAGLCNVGYRPIAYTIGNFLVHRCYEQLRDDVALHEYPVVLLGTSAGFDNASLGPTHHLIDDWGPLRNLPGFEVHAPASTEYASKILDVVLAGDRPAYLRVAKGAPSIPGSDAALSVFPGAAGGPVLVTYGSLAGVCLEVQRSRPETTVLVCNRVHPLPNVEVLASHLDGRQVLVAEDHFGHTGLYGALCQLVVERRMQTELMSAAPAHEYNLVVEQEAAGYLRRYGLDHDGLVDRLVAMERQTA
jgi:transketolase